MPMGGRGGVFLKYLLNQPKQVIVSIILLINSTCKSNVRDGVTYSCWHVKVKVILWPTVSRPVHPGIIWDLWPIFPILSLINFLDSFGFVDVGHPLWREVGSVLFSTAFLRSESHGTHEHILLSLFLRLPQPGGPISCIYFPQEQGSSIIPSGNGFV
jgi:hypothetical protein